MTSKDSSYKSLLTNCMNGSMIKHTNYRESLYRKGSIGYGLELARENIRNNGGSKVGYPESSVDILPFICEWCAF